MLRWGDSPTELLLLHSLGENGEPPSSSRRPGTLCQGLKGAGQDRRPH